MSKRRKGEGTKLKRVINGKEYFVAEVTENGKRYTAYSSKSHAQAKKRLQEKLDNDITGQKIYVKDLAEKWLQFKKDKVKIQTYQAYKSDIDNHIIPEFGNQHIHTITLEELERFYSTLSLSPASIRRLSIVMKLLFKYALKYDNIERDITNLVELPKNNSNRAFPILTDEQCKSLLQCAKDTKIYLPVRIALETGMRVGEILGLRYEDVANNQIVVSRTVIAERKKTGMSLGFDLVKNKIVRTIDITPDLCDTIRSKGTRGLIFTSPRAKTNFNIMNPSSFNYAWRALREKAGFPDLKFHDLRHIHISKLLEKGVSIPVVADRAGHKNPYTTLNVYAHVINKPNIADVVSYQDTL